MPRIRCEFSGAFQGMETTIANSAKSHQQLLGTIAKSGNEVRSESKPASQQSWRTSLSSIRTSRTIIRDLLYIEVHPALQAQLENRLDLKISATVKYKSTSRSHIITCEHLLNLPIACRARALIRLEL